MGEVLENLERTISGLREQLAWATKPCEYHREDELPDGFEAQCACRNTGRVYVLDGVREDCWCGNGTMLNRSRSVDDASPPTYIPHPSCKGQGQIAVEDGWVWWRVAYQSDWGFASTQLRSRLMRLVKEAFAGTHDENGMELAFFQALWQAVNQMPGVRWPE